MSVMSKGADWLERQRHWIPQTEKVSWVRWIRDACRSS